MEETDRLPPVRSWREPRRALPRARAPARPPRRRARRRVLRPAGAAPTGSRPSRSARPTPLADDARRLLADLDAGVPLDDAVDDPHRRRWLHAQAVGLRTTAERLAGVPISFVEEIERCYGVHAALRRRGRVRGRPPRPRGGACRAAARCAERYIAWKEAQAVPVEKLRPAIASLAEDFRERTDRLVRPARRRARRLRPRDRRAVVRVQLLPRRSPQPGRHQHRPAGARHRRSGTSSPTRPTRATTPSTAARRSGSCASGAGSRRRSSSSARRSACSPRGWPTSVSR